MLAWVFPEMYGANSSAEMAIWSKDRLMGGDRDNTVTRLRMQLRTASELEGYGRAFLPFLSAPAAPFAAEAIAFGPLFILCRAMISNVRSLSL